MKIRPSIEASPRLRVRKLLLACLATLGAWSPAHAACTYTLPLACLSDQPIQSANVVKPNIMFILDNSGSMSWDYMPDNASSTNNCRQNWQYNTIYYNPNYDYTAVIPKGAMGNTMPTQSFTSAAIDPFDTAPAYRNLSTSFCAQGGMAGTCSTGSSSTNSNAQPAYYYKYTGTGTPTPGNCFANGQYTKVVVSATSCQVGGGVTACPNGSADERTNFANWYSYFRTRRLMMKSGIASAFATLDDRFRVGLYTINSPNDTSFTNGAAQNIADFSGGGAGTPKGDWYTKLFKVEGNSSTPLQTALDAIGQYYSGSPPSGLSGDPVQYSCQRNFAILSTDGYWNQTPPNRGNWDRTVPATMPAHQDGSAYQPSETAMTLEFRSGTSTISVNVPGLTPGTNFPLPYYEGSTASSNTLADIAMYYWVRDLRTSGAASDNNVIPTRTDPAYWQHMTTFTVGLGVDGTLTYPGGLPTPTSGTNWPIPVSNGQTTIDDLWHAAINGHGAYYKANDPQSLSDSLNGALKGIGDPLAYGVGPASSTNNYRSPDQNDFTTYVASYRIANWSGNIEKYNVDRSTGTQTGSALWLASQKLDQKVNPGQTSTIHPTAYTTRNIVTRNLSGLAVDFDYANLSSAQQTALCYKASPGTGPCITTPTSDRDSLVNYLRGDATFEGDYGASGKRFRNRRDKTEIIYYKRDLIGSIVNAKPAYVSTEQASYLESSDPGFSAFKTSTQARAKTLYAPANDGMVHAFRASDGEELWAYVPSLIIPTGTDENGWEKGLRALSYQDSGGPAYYHHFYIDASPAVRAVDFIRTGGPLTLSSPSGDWRNILVGGLGKGGKGYYALDVTTPATTAAAARTAVLWEFPSSADASHSAAAAGLMGYSFGHPIIAKTEAYGWVVMVPSGYNNSDGFGYLFVLNAKTGTLLRTLRTPSLAPGMAHATGLVRFNNRFVRQVYGGDLNGSLWRFDVADQNPSNWTVTQIFSSSSATPITSAPAVAIDPNNGDRWIFFGTGKYLDVPDRSTTGTQYFVALRDGTSSSPRTGAPVALASLTSVTNLSTGVGSAPLGWKYALPDSGERIVMGPVSDLRTVLFASLIPTNDPCSPGISGYLYGLEYDTGASRLLINGSQVIRHRSNSGFSGLGFQASDSETVRASSNDGSTIKLGLDTRRINSGTRHLGWRELLDEY